MYHMTKLVYFRANSFFTFRLKLSEVQILYSKTCGLNCINFLTVVTCAKIKVEKNLYTKQSRFLLS